MHAHATAGLGKTVWVDRTMRAIWDRLAARVPPSWLPRQLAEPSRPGQLEEYGCGHYGCVMPTSEPGLVCKLTSDVSEARFVAMNMSLGRKAPQRGIVQYKAVFALSGMTHKNRPLFVLWRTEAFDVGVLMYDSSIAKVFDNDEYARRLLRGEVRSLLDQFQNEARVVRKYLVGKLRELERDGVATVDRKRVTSHGELLDLVQRAYQFSEYGFVTEQRGWAGAREVLGAPKWVKGMQRVGVALQNCRDAAEMLESTQYVDGIGHALDTYRAEGLLLADVHLNNIGMVMPWEEGYEHPELGITDPGHVVEIHPKWAGVVNIEAL